MAARLLPDAMAQRSQPSQAGEPLLEVSRASKVQPVLLPLPSLTASTIREEAWQEVMQWQTGMLQTPEAESEGPAQASLQLRCATVLGPMARLAGITLPLVRNLEAHVRALAKAAIQLAADAQEARRAAREQGEQPGPAGQASELPQRAAASVVMAERLQVTFRLVDRKPAQATDGVERTGQNAWTEGMQRPCTRAASSETANGQRCQAEHRQSIAVETKSAAASLVVDLAPV